MIGCYREKLITDPESEVPLDLQSAILNYDGEDLPRDNISKERALELATLRDFSYNSSAIAYICLKFEGGILSKCATIVLGCITEKPKLENMLWVNDIVCEE